jgi:hypothetical protein
MAKILVVKEINKLCISASGLGWEVEAIIGFNEPLTMHCP